jgi:hypothetical protein
VHPNSKIAKNAEEPKTYDTMDVQIERISKISTDFFWELKLDFRQKKSVPILEIRSIRTYIVSQVL